jgi:hypothetical protein
LEEGGVRTDDTFAIEPEPKSMPPLSVWPGFLPLARRYDGGKLSSSTLQVRKRGSKGRPRTILTRDISKENGELAFTGSPFSSSNCFNELVITS